MSATRSELQKKARSAVVQHAFFRWESAMVLAGTLVLTALFPHPFPRWPIWGWPLLGLLGLITLLYSTLSDADTHARVLLELYQEQLDPYAVQDQALRQEVETALGHQRAIETHLRGRRGPLRHWLVGIADQFSAWIVDVYQLALQLDAYRQGQLLSKERKAIPQQVEKLAARRRLERDPVIRREVEAALEAKGKQWQALRDLDALMQQVEPDLKGSTAAMASVYGQVELIDTADVASGQVDHLEDEIVKQIGRLDDLIANITSSVTEISKTSEGDFDI
jgi:hypothetical protein